MNRPLRVLHVASFTGNVGDNASHYGSRSIWRELLGEVAVERQEIRKTYRNYAGADAWRFDHDFVDHANSFDLLFIGGGGFLDYWVPGSRTGTTIDISPDALSRLSVPTVVGSVGCVPHREVPDGNLARFRTFLDAALANDRIRIAVRNDGSAEVLRDEVGESYLPGIPEVLDSGFFYAGVSAIPAQPWPDRYVAMNITADQLVMNSAAGPLDEAVYYRQLGQVVTHLNQAHGLHVVLVPHIQSDLRAFDRLLRELNPYSAREGVSVAACVQGDRGADWIFSVYRKSTLVIGGRFHANVCSLAMGVPTIGLAVLDRVGYSYRSIGLQDGYVSARGDLAADLVRKADQALAGPDGFIPDSTLDRFRKDTVSTYSSIFDQLLG